MRDGDKRNKPKRAWSAPFDATTISISFLLNKLDFLLLLLLLMILLFLSLSLSLFFPFR